jgi:hypothetical protein
MLCIVRVNCTVLPSRAVCAVLAFTIAHAHLGLRYDPEPILSHYLFIPDDRVIKLKAIVRDVINAAMHSAWHCSIVHSSDDDLETWEYVENMNVGPSEVAALHAEVARLREQHQEHRTVSVSPHSAPAHESVLLRLSRWLTFQWFQRTR